MGESGGLMIGGAKDPAEAKADARASRALASGPLASPPVRRKCAACEAEETAQRNPAANVVAPGAAPARASKAAETAVNSLGPGRSLSAPDRAFYEPRLGADFSAVRLHEDAGADSAAHAMDASAFTLGKDIVFASGERQRGGPRLLAHELAHAAEAVPEVRRKLTVKKPAREIARPGGKGVKQTNGETVLKYLDEICFFGTPKVERSGEVKMDDPMDCTVFRGLLGHGCDCMCDLIGSKNDWTIKVSDTSKKKKTWPHTLPDSGKLASDPKGGGTSGAIVVPSPNDTMEYGLAGKDGTINVARPWGVLAHEMCGHARLMDKGEHPAENKDHLRHGHEKVVEETNKIRDEYFFDVLPLRGNRIQDPYCGESFSRKKGETKWKPSSFIEACKRQRRKYLKSMRKADPKNPAYRKKYKLKDKLP